MTPKVQENPQMSYVEVTERKRLNEACEHDIPWKKWGPFLSERQWETVRDDYSQNGDVWNYFSHDQARRFRRWRLYVECYR